MKAIRTILCVGMICFLLFTPNTLIKGAQKTFVDSRFVRNTDRYQGTIFLYHIVRHRPYSGSLTQWLNARAAEYEKKHKGTYLEIEGLDESGFYERLEGGRKADAYSFFSGSVYRDLLKPLSDLGFPLRNGIFQTDRCVPYCYTGYAKLIKKPDSCGEKRYFASDVLSALYGDGGETVAEEEKADVLYADLRKAGDLIRYKEGFSIAALDPLDSFTDAVCWLGIERDTDERKAQVILDFFSYLLEPDAQQTLNALGLLSVRADVKNTAPESALKKVFSCYETVQTVDPFLWNLQYDALSEDAALAAEGDKEAKSRFLKRLRECCR